MISRDFLGGLAATTIGGLYFYQASTLRVSSLADSFGPRGMPLVYGGLMLGLGLVLVAQSVLRHRALTADERSRSSDEWRGQGRRILWAAGLAALAFGYVLLISTLGYLVAMLLLIFAVALYLGAPLGWRPLAIAAAGAVVLWMIFVIVLDVSMPAGLLAGLG